jgi:hypothetical protein
MRLIAIAFLFAAAANVKAEDETVEFYASVCESGKVELLFKDQAWPLTDKELEKTVDKIPGATRMQASTTRYRATPGETTDQTTKAKRRVSPEELLESLKAAVKRYLAEHGIAAVLTQVKEADKSQICQ